MGGKIVQILSREFRTCARWELVLIRQWMTSRALTNRTVNINHISAVFKAFSVTWPAHMQIYWSKRKRLRRKRAKLPQDWFGIHWHTNMAAIISFTRMAAMTSRENALQKIWLNFIRIRSIGCCTDHLVVIVLFASVDITSRITVWKVKYLEQTGQTACNIKGLLFAVKLKLTRLRGLFF